MGQGVESVWQRLARAYLRACLAASALCALSGCLGEPPLLDKIPTPVVTVSTAASPTPTARSVSTATPARTPTLQATATVTALAAVSASPSRTATSSPTRTPSPATTAIVSPTATARATATRAPIRLTQPGNCPDQGITISGIAADGRILSISGTAATATFAYYKIEYQPAQSEAWNFVARSDTPVTNGPLHVWDTSTLAPGRYRVRLAVVDVTGNYPGPCTIEIEIRE